MARSQSSQPGMKSRATSPPRLFERRTAPNTLPRTSQLQRALLPRKIRSNAFSTGEASEEEHCGRMMVKSPGFRFESGYSSRQTRSGRRRLIQETLARQHYNFDQKFTCEEVPRYAYRRNYSMVKTKRLPLTTQTASTEESNLARTLCPPPRAQRKKSMWSRAIQRRTFRRNNLPPLLFVQSPRNLPDSANNNPTQQSDTKILWRQSPPLTKCEVPVSVIMNERMQNIVQKIDAKALNNISSYLGLQSVATLPLLCRRFWQLLSPLVQRLQKLNHNVLKNLHPIDATIRRHDSKLVDIMLIGSCMPPGAISAFLASPRSR